MKKIAFIYQQPPYGSVNPSEALDLALAGTAFEHDINLIFLGEAIYWLHKEQKGKKTFLGLLSALDLYDIKPPYVVEEDLHQCGFSLDNLIAPVVVLKAGELQALIAKQDIIL